MNKTGHFNFAENRTFLLCLDRKMRPTQPLNPLLSLGKKGEEKCI
ncbi:MAG: hypothetical protein ACOX2F_05350 [bacterium]